MGIQQRSQGKQGFVQRRRRVRLRRQAQHFAPLRPLFGCKLTVVPASYPADKVLAMNPDGILFSNGPGDPSAVPYAVENAKQILGKLPAFGICMGHQVLGQAFGGSTFKLKFGHHGGNHPVRGPDGAVEISSQNHNFAVDPKTTRWRPSQSRQPQPRHGARMGVARATRDDDSVPPRGVSRSARFRSLFRRFRSNDARF